MEPQASAHSRADALVLSEDPQHPANLIPRLCHHFYGLGWVTGTGGGLSIRSGDRIYIAPSGVQKELIQPSDMFCFDYLTRTYLRSPKRLKPSACTPLFLAAFDRGAMCCIHTHSIWAVLVTLLVEKRPSGSPVFAINRIEQIKGIGRGRMESSNLGYHDTLQIPIIDNTAHEQDLRESLEQAMDRYPTAYAVLVRRHGVYVWGETVQKAKTQCESLDYLFQLAVEMERLTIPWMSSEAQSEETDLLPPPDLSKSDGETAGGAPVLRKRARSPADTKGPESIQETMTGDRHGNAAGLVSSGPSLGPDSRDGESQANPVVKRSKTSHAQSGPLDVADQSRTEAQQVALARERTEVPPDSAAGNSPSLSAIGPPKQPHQMPAPAKVGSEQQSQPRRSLGQSKWSH